MEHSSSHLNDPSTPAAAGLTEFCGPVALHCEACGSRDGLAVILRVTKPGPTCMTACPRCAQADPHPLTPQGARVFADDHTRHITREMDRQRGST